MASLPLIDFFFFVVVKFFWADIYMPTTHMKLIRVCAS